MRHDAKTLARLSQMIAPEVSAELHERMVQLTQERGGTLGLKQNS
jgi:hypothetical protein